MSRFISVAMIGWSCWLATSWLGPAASGQESSAIGKDLLSFEIDRQQLSSRFSTTLDKKQHTIRLKPVRQAQSETEQIRLNNDGLIPTIVVSKSFEPPGGLETLAQVARANHLRLEAARGPFATEFASPMVIALKVVHASVDQTGKIRLQVKPSVSTRLGAAYWVAMSPEVWELEGTRFRLIQFPQDWASGG